MIDDISSDLKEFGFCACTYYWCMFEFELTDVKGKEKVKDGLILIDQSKRKCHQYCK